MKKEKEKYERNLETIELNSRRFAYGPLWRNYVPSYISDQSKRRRRLFEPKKQGDSICL